MSKSNVYKFRNKTARKPKKHKAADQNGAMQDGSPGESPHLNLTISSSRASPETPKEPCEDHRPLVNEFLKGFYAKNDIICEVRYCTMCAWVASNSSSMNICPVCGQAIRTINFVLEREVLANFENAIVEITLKK
jgi:hypothetical protein